MKSPEKSFEETKLKEQKDGYSVNNTTREMSVDELIEGIRSKIQRTLEKSAEREGRHKR